MWDLIISFPVLIASMILETTVFSRIHILHGNADLIMLVIIAWSLHPSTRYSWFWFILGSFIMTYLSALPMYGYFIIYGIIWLLITFLKRRVWQMPVILMLFLTIFGTFLENFFSIASLFLQNVNLNYSEIITQIMIPSLILNLLLAIPVFGIINDFAETIYFRSEES
jgi:cell shape-determining protein MreD